MNSQVVQGLVLKRDTEGSVKSLKGVKVAVYGCAIDTAGTETKGTVLVRNVRIARCLRFCMIRSAATGEERSSLHSAGASGDGSRLTDWRRPFLSFGEPPLAQAAELEGYAAGEEKKIEDAIKAIVDTGAKARGPLRIKPLAAPARASGSPPAGNCPASLGPSALGRAPPPQVLVTGQSVGEMALHFCEKFGLMVIKIPSKFELRRFCRTVNAVALIKLDPPQADELGFVSSVAVEEIGGTRCVVVKQEDATSNVSTVVIRGATDNAMDDVERAVDDGINGYKALCRDARLVPAGGATEIEIAARLAEYGRKETGLDQYAIQKFAAALEVVPRTLAENAGLNATDVIAQLFAAHAVSAEPGGVLRFPCCLRRSAEVRTRVLTRCFSPPLCARRATGTPGWTSRGAPPRTCPLRGSTTSSRPSGGRSSWRSTRW